MTNTDDNNSGNNSGKKLWQKTMTDSFHIITALKSAQDWAHHESNEREQKLAALKNTADIANQRDLGQSAKRFRPSEALLNAINAALAARVPLLLTGEPGTGKTQVAWYLQRYLDIPLYGYQVHSNSQAADMRYDFDAVAYLRDAYLEREDKQINDTTSADPQANSLKDPRSNPKYLKPGALWKAYDPAVREEKDQNKTEVVLLIDEIDKAPRDFPNDLLQELDQHQFAHPFETGENNKTVKRQGAPPIIIITSNGERRLPDAFLRRCMVHHIELTPDLLKDIMQAWGNQFPHLEQTERDMALHRFQQIRKKRLSKLPGSAEFLLWLSVLSAQNKKLTDLDENIPLDQLPALTCLIKDNTDYRLLKD